MKMEKAEGIKKSMTIGFLTGLLAGKGLLSEADAREVSIKGETQRVRLKKAQESFYSSKKLLSISAAVSPAEVIASLQLRVPGTGKPLTEDMITEAVAGEVGLPYMKLD